MATVIFSNAGDTDTAVLKFIWRGLPNVKLVEVNKQTANAKEIVEQANEIHTFWPLLRHSSSLFRTP